MRPKIWKERQPDMYADIVAETQMLLCSAIPDAGGSSNSSNKSIIIRHPTEGPPRLSHLFRVRQKSSVKRKTSNTSTLKPNIYKYIIVCICVCMYVNYIYIY